MQCITHISSVFVVTGYLGNLNMLIARVKLLWFRGKQSLQTLISTPISGWWASAVRSFYASCPNPFLAEQSILFGRIKISHPSFLPSPDLRLSHTYCILMTSWSLICGKCIHYEEVVSQWAQCYRKSINETWSISLPISSQFHFLVLLHQQKTVVFVFTKPQGMFEFNDPSTWLCWIFRKLI